MLLPIEIKANAKPSDEKYSVQMSFYDNKNRPFGDKIVVKFMIVSESHNLLDEIDLEVYKLALKLRD